MTDTERPTRQNGLAPPYTPAQISTWIFLPVLVLEFLFVLSPMLPLAASILCTIVFCGFAMASTFFGYMAMKVDPSDPRLLNAKNDNPDTHCCIDPQEPTKQCWICDVQVGAKSMHCKFCNKCVDQFDHHCMWLNTCVGKKNYHFFFRTMICISLMLLVQASIQMALIVDIYIGNGASKQRALDWFSVNATTPVVVIMGIFLLFDLVSLSLIGQLLVFHLKLQRDGISTYQFIVRQNQERRERTKKENELKARRESAIAKAKEEGNGFLVFRLQQAGWFREKSGCAICDPLSLDAEDDKSNNSTNGKGNNSAPNSEP
mmetsp:Transcript_8190/g.20283  ORF Transcript_8190/g.20283 Transcript_8190/m.20283 type:complete len:317 (-) Transcript_8190:322-1272(-)